MEKMNIEKNIIFNFPLEIALRLLFIFNSSSIPLDLQRLIYYNYILVHSSDIPNGPKSIHADLPRRSCEMLVNRPIIKKGLTLLLSKDLISVQYDRNGIQFRKNKNTSFFINYFESSYSQLLRDRSNWLSSEFDEFNDEELAQIIESNIGKWGSEFSVIYEDVEYHA